MTRAGKLLAACSLCLITCIALADELPGSAVLERGLRKVEDAAPKLPEPDWSKVAVSLYVVATTRGGSHAIVDDGAVLHTGDRLAFYISVGAPTHVQLLQVTADGHVEFLFPESGETALLQPGRERRVPEGNFSFELDAHTGPERIVLLASKKPLARADRTLQGLMSEIRETSRWPDSAEPDPVRSHPGPGHASSLTRGGLKLDSGTGRTMELVANARGVAFRALTILHRP